jgi:hypothetical protein
MLHLLGFHLLLLLLYLRQALILLVNVLQFLLVDFLSFRLSM